jgi:hypothetical protein
MFQPCLPNSPVSVYFIRLQTTLLLDTKLFSSVNMNITFNDVLKMFTVGVCILLRVYQIKSLDKPSFATSIVRILFYALFMFMFM